MTTLPVKTWSGRTILALLMTVSFWCRAFIDIGTFWTGCLDQFDDKTATGLWSKWTYQPSLSLSAYHPEPRVEYCARNVRPPGKGIQGRAAKVSKRVRSPRMASERMRPKRCEPVTPLPE